MNSYFYRRLVYCRKVLDGLVSDEQLFIFMACAPQDPETGDVDYTNPEVLEMANPSYGVTIRPADILADAIKAQNVITAYGHFRYIKYLVNGWTCTAKPKAKRRRRRVRK